MRFIIIPWNPLCSVGFGIRSKWISALKEHWGNKLLSNNIMGNIYVFCSNLVLSWGRRFCIYNLHVSICSLLSGRTYPVSIFCGQFPPFLRTFFVLGKERFCQNFSFMRGKKKNRQKKNSNFLRFAKNCNEVPVFMMELFDWPGITNKFR